LLKINLEQLGVSPIRTAAQRFKIIKTLRLSSFAFPADEFVLYSAGVTERKNLVVLVKVDLPATPAQSTKSSLLKWLCQRPERGTMGKQDLLNENNVFLIATHIIVQSKNMYTQLSNS
jgi:hypothetical protein